MIISASIAMIVTRFFTKQNFLKNTPIW
jgi:hypothetical protein